MLLELGKTGLFFQLQTFKDWLGHPFFCNHEARCQELDDKNLPYILFWTCAAATSNNRGPWKLITARCFLREIAALILLERLCM